MKHERRDLKGSGGEEDAINSAGFLLTAEYLLCISCFRELALLRRTRWVVRRVMSQSGGLERFRTPAMWIQSGYRIA